MITADLSVNNAINNSINNTILMLKLGRYLCVEIFIVTWREMRMWSGLRPYSGAGLLDVAGWWELTLC